MIRVTWNRCDWRNAMGWGCPQFFGFVRNPPGYGGIMWAGPLEIWWGT